MAENKKTFIFYSDWHNMIKEMPNESAGSYPADYDFKTNKVVYLVGMSVPPVMTANIAEQIYTQWIRNI